MTTQLEVLQWNLETYSTERPTKDTIYLLEANNKYNKTINELTGQDVFELFEAGQRPSIDEYLVLVKKINPSHLSLIKEYIDTSNIDPNHILTIFNKNYMTYDNYNKHIKSKGLSPITNDLLETILTYYLIYNGVRAGYLDNRAPKDVYQLGELYTEELIHIIYLLNGVFKPNTITNDWTKGQYTDYSYLKVKFIVKHLIKERPDLIGTLNIQIQRELKLNQLLQTD